MKPSFKIVSSVAALMLFACSGSGPTPGTSPGAGTGMVGKALGDISGAIFEGDYTVGDGQLRHMILQLSFVDQVVSGRVLAVSSDSSVVIGTVSGSWQRPNDSDDITGTLSVQSDTSSEDLELTFSGNPSGISGTLSSIVNSPEGSTSSSGSFSLTATGASGE